MGGVEEQVVLQYPDGQSGQVSAGRFPAMVSADIHTAGWTDWREPGVDGVTEQKHRSGRSVSIN